MPYTPLKISIPEPCGENWEAMHPVPNTTARHCDSCAKNVVDFTGFTDAQVHKYMRESGGKLCGRFRPDQLGRPLRAVTTPAASPLRKVAAAAGLLLAATGCSDNATVGEMSLPDDLSSYPSDERYTHLETEVIPPRTGGISIDPIDEQGTVVTVPGMVDAPPPPPIAGEPVLIEDTAVPPPAKNMALPDAQAEDDWAAYELVGDITIDEVWDDPLEVPSTIPVPPPPTPPPPPAVEDGIFIEEVGEMEWIEEPEQTTATDSTVVSCQEKSRSLTAEDIRNLPTRDISGMTTVVMGVVMYTPPKAPTLADSIRDFVSPPPAPENPSSNPRPRPISEFLTDLQPYPNPFVDEIRLEIDAPDAGTLQVEMIDAAGRRILRQHWETTAGYNELTLRPRQRKLRGELFYVRLTSAAGETIAKPVVRR